jgi:transposase InsO family protein
MSYRLATTDRAPLSRAQGPATGGVAGHNGSCFTVRETLAFAHAVGLVPCFTPVRSPESNGIAEAFVKTFKRDYVRLSARPDAAAVMAELERSANRTVSPSR